MSATRYDFILNENRDTDFTIQVWQDDAHTVVQDITGYQATLVVRDFRDSGHTALLTLTSSPPTGLTINGVAGQIAVHISATAATNLTWLHGQWDIQATNATTSVVKLVAYGNVSVRAGV